MEDEDAEDNVLERVLARTKEPTRLSFRILARITNNFSDERKIGEGGFGVVYKGILRSGSRIAVKKIKMDRHTVNDRYFGHELTSLLHINHKNVVRFLGFCYEITHEAIIGTGPQNVQLPQTRERLLCFEYISNTSLDKYITDELRGLEWNTRIQIIKGICTGLKYLHEDKQIIHLDLKPKNILVDDDMEPKITDFGVARVAENPRTTVACLTRGYCAPEYENGGKPTLKCDIYSLGVIIIELLTGQGPTDKIKDLSPYQVLRRWKWSYKWNISARKVPLQAQEVTKWIEIAERCVDKEPERRPSISEIITMFNETEDTTGDIIGVDMVRHSEDDMLGIQPLELRFGIEPNKQISSRVEVKLTNETVNCVAFNIKAKFPLQCSKIRGIVQGSGGTHVITVQAQESTTLLPYMPDKVIVQSTKVKLGLTEEEITEHMFNDEASEVVDNVILKIVYDEAEEQQAEPTNVPISKDDNIASSSSKGQRLNFHPPQKTLANSDKTTSTNNPYTNNKAISIQAVDVVAGAMGPLLPKLRKLLKPGNNLLQPRVKKDMVSLEKQLNRMQDTLYKVSMKQLDQLEREEKCWADDVRELSFDIEDLVDGLQLCSEGSDPTTNKPDNFEGLQETIQDVMDHVEDLVKYRPGLAGDSAPDYDPRLEAYLREDRTRLVGIDSTMHALVKRLMGGDDDMSKQKLKIISIFGDGGLGKTTLARAVYDNLAGVFILKAFIMVGRNRDIKWILEDILLQLKEDEYNNIHSRNWDQMKLTQEIRKVLNKKRYLVVIDDIWDKKLWGKIEMAFIDDNCGSKIITTSRIFHVAKNSEDCKLEPLSYQHSKKLFYETLSSRGKITPSLDEPEEQCTVEILKKCGGVPLAIITIASLLAEKEEQDWPKVYESIGFGHEDNEDVNNTRKILLYSYYDLPHYLKTCLLHVSTFPEDHEIEKNTLVWRWVAEGFVQGEKEKTLFMVGERYFNELINRSLLQPAEGTTYTIHFCRVHHMVLDMICSVVKEKNFVGTLLDSDEQDPCYEGDEKYARRLSIRNRDVSQQDLAKSCSQKQLRSFSAIRCRFVFDLMSLLPSFQVLRLLSTDRCYFTGNHSLQNIAALHHLRYLGLSRTNIADLPTELGKFRFLQTLDLRGNEIKVLPQSVKGLRELKCFRSEGTPMTLPDEMGELTSLEELRLDKVFNSPNFVKELGNLTELRVLHISTYMFSDILNEALVQSLSKLKKLEELELCDGETCKAPNWHGFLPSERLRHLRLDNIRYSRGLPAWINEKSLPLLSHLNVRVMFAAEQDLDVLGRFPELGSLVLLIDKDRVFPHTISAGGFPKLQYYYMLSPLKYESGAMPWLQVVEFDVDVKAYRDAKTEINLDSLKYLPSLMRVHAKIICWEVTMREAKAAETAVRKAVNNHDKCPILVLKRNGSCTDQVKLISNSDVENVVLGKLRSRVMVQIQRDEKELDYEHIDPTDPEVINYHLKFKDELPSIIESIIDETIDEGLPSLVESILNEMIDECRQKEGGSSSSQQVITRNSDFGTQLPSIIKSTIKEIHYLGQLGASNPKQINSADLEALKQNSRMRAELTSIIKFNINRYGQAEINSMSSYSAYSGLEWFETLLKSQKHKEVEKYNFELIDSIYQEVTSRNSKFKNEQPSIDESMFDEILDQGSVESALNEMLDKCRQREARASSSKQVTTHDSSFDGVLPSMIKSIIKENEGRHENASNPEQINSTDLEVISHDSDLKAAIASVIKLRIDKCRQGDIEESNSEQIDSTDQEINSSSSNIGEVWMKTLLESQMYKGKQTEAEKYNFEQIDSIKQEAISRNSIFRNEQPSIDESILDEILDQGLPYMVESFLDQMLDECRQREARASSSKQVISHDSNFEALLPSMIKSIIKENDGRQGELSNPENINSTELEIISHDSDLKAALTAVIKFRIDKCGQAEAESNSEQIGSTDQEINSSRSNTEAVRIKTLLVSQMYEGEQGAAKESNSEHINSIGTEINNISSYFGLIWFKVLMVIQMLERRRQEDIFDFERMDYVNQELHSPEDRPVEIHQQHFRFPVAEPYAEI